MRQEMNKEKCQQLLLLLGSVGEAFQYLEENAERLAKSEEVLCDLSPEGPLGKLAQQAEKVADDANVMCKSWMNPLTLKPVAADLFASNPLLVFPKAVETLRELVQWDCNKPLELERTIAWLQPQGVIVFGDVGCYNRDGTLSRSNTATQLAFECRRSRSVLDKWGERAEAEGARLACADAEQAKSQAEEKMGPLKEEVTFLRTQTLERLEKVDKSINGFKDTLVRLLGKIEGFSRFCENCPVPWWHCCFQNGPIRQRCWTRGWHCWILTLRAYP